MAEVDLNKSGIYQIINLINEKIYIGSAIKFRKRWNLHKLQLRKNIHENRHLQAAWNKYGEESFSFEILEYVEKQFLLLIEQQYINTKNCEYNISRDVTRSRLGVKSTDEHIEKIRQANLGQKRSKEACEKIGLAKKGVKLSEEQKQARRDYRHTDETKIKIASRKDWKHSEEAKLKMSLARKATVERKNQEFLASLGL